MADEFCLKIPDFHVTFRDLLHAVNLRHGIDSFTSPPKEGVLRILSPWKIRRLRLGLNQRTWVPKASTLPLDHRSRRYATLKHATIISFLGVQNNSRCFKIYSRFVTFRKWVRDISNHVSVIMGMRWHSLYTRLQDEPWGWQWASQGRCNSGVERLHKEKRYMISTPHQILFGRWNNTNEVGEAFSTYGERRGAYTVFVGRPEGKR